MTEWFPPLRPVLNLFRSTKSLRSKLAVILFCFIAVGVAAAAAQTITISGKVYDPRTTSSSLPLPNVLVYVTTSPVPALPSGVQCMTYQAPANAISFTYTAVDGTFVLNNVPANTTYTLVIQAGKWRRQFVQPVAMNPVAGLALHMPSNHSQGDIPMIAIATGSVDAAECVLLDMGVASSEFTDDNGSTNAGGHIHLYQGSTSPGAQINASTPAQSTLMSSASIMNAYDMVMLPCQGTSLGQANETAATNLLNYANAGGRLFTTHYSLVWLVPDAPYNSQFPPVANWSYNKEQQILSGVGTVETNFSEGDTLAQWLTNSGATAPGTSDQINIAALRTDVDSVIAPTQSWVTLNNGSYSGGTVTNNPVMQMTFNTPVGAPAANQCGRVMFSDYHVFNITQGNQIFPAECADPATHVMTPQEEMLEYALFDLSTFVRPVVVPTLDIAFNPSPLIVKQNDSGDQITVSVTNTSSTTETSSSAILSFKLPPLITVASMIDSTGGWICNASTLTCTRTTGLAAGATDSVALTLNVAAYPAGGLSMNTDKLTATVSSDTFSTNEIATDIVIYQLPPPITWATPAPIVYGTALSSTQLNAKSTVPGAFSYNPPAGTILAQGQQMLNVNFAPTDTTNYLSGTASVSVNVLSTTPNVDLTASKNAAFLNNSISFSATIPIPVGGAGGTVTFYDGSAQIGTASILEGAASVSTSSLAAGAHSIRAAYSGDSNYGPSTSSAIQVEIQDFTLGVKGGGVATVLAASKVALTLTLAPIGGSTMPGNIKLSHGVLPFGSSVSFSNEIVAANSPATSITLLVSMPGSVTAAQQTSGRGVWPIAFALLLLPLGLKVRRVRGWLVLALISTALATGVTGCGATFIPQSFSFPVTAVSGGLSHSVTVNITVRNNASK